MAVHKNLNTKTPLEPQHFRQWLYLFNATIDELFAGRHADLAKQQAANIAAVMQMKISNDKAFF